MADCKIPAPIALTRDAIRSGEVRRFMEAQVDVDATGYHLNTDADLLASRQAMFAGGAPTKDVWLFGYGSLIWNPAIEYAERQPCTIYGFHRSFCLWSTLGRGTPERPGLMLGQDRGGSCRGVAFRIPRAAAETELDIVWRREMSSDAYRATWLKGRTADGRALRAIGFVVRREHQRYAGTVPEARMVSAIAGARGFLGSCADYLINTVDHLDEMATPDRRMARLRDKVVEHLATTPQN